MTAPIDLECPACKVLPGRYCKVLPAHDGYVYHHAERIDAAFRASAALHENPMALRGALRAALNRIEAGSSLDDQSFISATRETFGL